MLTALQKYANYLERTYSSTFWGATEKLTLYCVQVILRSEESFGILIQRSKSLLTLLAVKEYIDSETSRRYDESKVTVLY